ncbi:CoA transferase [Citreimonas salinaria]|uniref:CoA-transferase family III n=1 Tax=Citreimonas salinaria TaxID=321339 RepID=A0A1H3NJ19_9RHOB|nr:CoA transferase [Citreimonas salinaria]SDY88229.1 CoA-transferase family III [Citreimonas salinaria]
MTNALPLHDIKILDATHVIAGPFATYQLALMVADVTRVERVMGSEFVRTRGGTKEMKKRRLGASFLSQNACKRSIALNLKDLGAVRIFTTLAGEADVVVENFRPGVVKRLGISYDELIKVNPPLSRMRRRNSRSLGFSRNEGTCRHGDAIR